MPIVPVLVQEWQQTCCGDPFAVGSAVAWTLELRDAAEALLPEEVAGSVAVRASVYGSGEAVEGRVPTLVRGDGGLVALWRAPLRYEGDTRVRGVFVEEHHGELPEDFEPARGVVRRVRALWEQYDVRVENGSRVFRAVPGGAADLREVSASTDDPLAGGAHPGDDWLFEGWVVDLEVGR